MTIKRVTVNVEHTFDLGIPDALLDEDSWELSAFIYDAFMDDEESWDNFDFNIRDLKEKN